MKNDFIVLCAMWFVMGLFTEDLFVRTFDWSNVISTFVFIILALFYTNLFYEDYVKNK